jgi:hypothetical protein
MPPALALLTEWVEMWCSKCVGMRIIASVQSLSRAQSVYITAIIYWLPLSLCLIIHNQSTSDVGGGGWSGWMVGARAGGVASLLISAARNPKSSTQKTPSQVDVFVSLSWLQWEWIYLFFSPPRFPFCGTLHTHNSPPCECRLSTLWEEVKVGPFFEWRWLL